MKFDDMNFFFSRYMLKCSKFNIIGKDIFLFWEVCVIDKGFKIIEGKFNIRMMFLCKREWILRL